METKPQFWWLKTPEDPQPDTSSSLAEFLHQEKKIENSLTELLEEQRKTDSEVDIPSILEEIDRVAAQSPLGPFEKGEERSVEEIMKEAERIFAESSKSFEQLSGRSKATSQNVTEIGSKSSTPTPKSVSPLPNEKKSSESESYSEDFSVAEDENGKESVVLKLSEEREQESQAVVSRKELEVQTDGTFVLEGDFKDETAVRMLELENDRLKKDVEIMQSQLKQTQALLDQTKKALVAKSMQSPEINLELERAHEEVKDTKEKNTALQLQLDTLNRTHQILKNSYDELSSSNKVLERRVAELDTTLAKYKSELANVKEQKAKLEESEGQLTRLLEAEKMQVKSLKLQNEKDAKCILDLNRQIREMERIISRKHPDSVSALIVAAKDDAADSNLTARKVLEDRIRILEKEAMTRDVQSSKIFLEVQEKFNQMKLKYESHIEDLELHVADLKSQLKRKVDTYDVYTQTFFDEQKIPQKETSTKTTQTTEKHNPKPLKREETHLLATIRGLQTDLSNKEKTILRLQKELDELKNTNKRLQREREGNLRHLSERREFRSYPEKLVMQTRSDHGSSLDLAQQEKLEEELRAVKAERDKMKVQLCRIEGDYQSLKAKRLQDLTALQEAHEREVANYLSNIAPLREQLEVQQVSLANLQSQLGVAKEQLAIVTVERDHLNNRLNSLDGLKNYEVPFNGNVEDDTRVALLQRKISHLEKRYEEREHRLRAIVQGLAQKSVTNRSCEQCAVRQQQLIGYKTELDQLLATLRSLK